MKDLMTLFETTGTYHKMTPKEQQLVDARDRAASKTQYPSETSKR